MESNKKLGSEFERRFCETLSDYGFWVHNMAMQSAGQPADVIAVRNKEAYLIDCKVVSTERFNLSRIEDNQHNAMMLWQMCDNGEGFFALLMGNEVYMIPHYTMMGFINAGYGSLSAKDIYEVGIPLQRWVSKCK